MDIQLALHLVFAALGLGAGVALLTESAGPMLNLLWLSLFVVLATGLGLSMPGGTVIPYGNLLYAKILGTVVIGGVLYWLSRSVDVGESGFDVPKLGLPALLWLVVFLAGVQLAHP